MSAPHAFFDEVLPGGDSMLRLAERFGRKESLRRLAARTDYFRETYAYGTRVIDGIERMMEHEGFSEGARKIFDRPVIEPAIVYANFLVPGQELALTIMDEYIVYPPAAAPEA